VSVSGTLTGPQQVEKLVGIDDLDLELPLSDHLLVLRYDDRPGVIGAIGGLLGDAGVNIGSMQVARPEAGGQAIGVLILDQVVPPAVLEQIVTTVGAVSGRRVDLT
jgi:D-3-phosphoglycerate dehydrogenase